MTAHQDNLLLVGQPLGMPPGQVAAGWPASGNARDERRSETRVFVYPRACSIFIPAYARRTFNQSALALSVTSTGGLAGSSKISKTWRADTHWENVTMALSGLSVICSLLALSWTVTQAKNVSQACKSQCQQIVVSVYPSLRRCEVCVLSSRIVVTVAWGSRASWARCLWIDTTSTEASSHALIMSYVA